MKVFTTGQVAKICKVAPRTVSKWFDSGRLKGYRIPGSQDRRIPRDYLIRFLKEHGMPLGDLEDETMAKILVVCQDQVLIENLRRELPAEKSFKLGVASSGFEAGIQAESFHPDCIIVDFSIGRHEALQICQNLRRNPEFTETILIAQGAGMNHGGQWSAVGGQNVLFDPRPTTTGPWLGTPADRRFRLTRRGMTLRDG
jgi:excisionase family DNA binding protein